MSTLASRPQAAACRASSAAASIRRSIVDVLSWFVAFCCLGLIGLMSLMGQMGLMGADKTNKPDAADRPNEPDGADKPDGTVC